MDEDEDIHPAMKLLFSCIDTNPDEYARGMFRQNVDAVKQYLTDQERSLLKQKSREAALGLLHKDLMRFLLSANDRK
jgi:hypothetical protein